MNKKLTIPATARSRNRESQKFFHRKIDTSIPSLGIGFVYGRGGSVNVKISEEKAEVEDGAP